MAQFVVDRLQPVLQLDASLLVEALSSDVNSANDCEDKFDGISYYKGKSSMNTIFCNHECGNSYLFIYYLYI